MVLIFRISTLQRRTDLARCTQEPRGLNVEDETAHGLATHEFLGHGIAIWIVHALILLGVIRLQSAPVQDVGEQPHEEH
jgi:hypothetical protein